MERSYANLCIICDGTKKDQVGFFLLTYQRVVNVVIYDARREEYKTVNFMAEAL